MKPEDLMLGYCRGNDADFAALYRLIAPRLLGYLCKVLRDPSTAEDVLQLTFIKLHKARSAYRPGVDPLPWVYTIAHRTCLDELRRRRRSLVRLSMREGLEPQLESVSREAELDTHALDDVRSRVWAALAGLTAEQRTALVLTKLQGKSHAEVAADEGISVGAVKLRAHRACGRLRAQLQAARA